MRVSANSLKSFWFAPATAKPTGTPLASTSNERLVPLLARSVGLGPVFFPRQGRLAHRPIHRKPTPVDAVEAVVLGQTCLPEAQKEAVLDPLLKAVVGRRAGANAGGRQRVPLATGPQHEKDALRALTIRHAGPPAAKAVGVFVRRQERFHQRPKLIADPKASTRTLNALGPEPGARLDFFGCLHLSQRYHEIGYSDRPLAKQGLTKARRVTSRLLKKGRCSRIIPGFER